MLTANTHLWKVLAHDCQSLSGQAVGLDFAIYGSCTHGLGHALTFYVSSGLATLEEASAACMLEPQGHRQLIRLCLAGFSHEYLRAYLWRLPGGGQRFAPYGFDAPCDTQSVNVGFYECLVRLVGDVDYSGVNDLGRNGRMDVLDSRWMKVASAGSHAVVSLTSAGRAVWKDTASFCAATHYSLAQRQACVNVFVQYMVHTIGMLAVKHVAQHTGCQRDACLEGLHWNLSSWEVEPLTTTYDDGVRVPCLHVEPVLVNGQPLRLIPLTSEVDVMLVVCEIAAGTSGFQVWRACASLAFVPARYSPAIGPDRRFVDADPYVDPPFSFSQSTARVTARVGNLSANVAGGASLESMRLDCHRTFNASRFAPGTEEQLRFTLWLCLQAASDNGFATPYEWTSEPQLWGEYTRNHTVTLTSAATASGGLAVAMARAPGALLLAATEARPILLIHIPKVCCRPATVYAATAVAAGAPPLPPPRMLPPPPPARIPNGCRGMHTTAARSLVRPNTDEVPWSLACIEQTGGDSIIESLGIQTVGISEGHFARHPACKGVPTVAPRHLRHMRSAEARQYYTEVEWQRAYKITFVRNPWQRLVSAWAQKMKMLVNYTRGVVPKPPHVEADAMKMLACGCWWDNSSARTSRRLRSEQASSATAALDASFPCSFEYWIESCHEAQEESRTGSGFTHSTGSQLEFTTPFSKWSQLNLLSANAVLRLTLVDFIGRTENLREHLRQSLVAAGNSEALAAACAASLPHITHGSSHLPYAGYYHTIRTVQRDALINDGRVLGYEFNQSATPIGVVFPVPGMVGDSAPREVIDNQPARTSSEDRHASDWLQWFLLSCFWLLLTMLLLAVLMCSRALCAADADRHRWLKRAASHKSAFIFLLANLSVLAPATADMFIPCYSQMQDDLNTKSSSVTLGQQLSAAAQGVAGLLVGIGSDLIGRRPMVLSCLAVYIAASALCAWAPTIALLNVFRVLQGVGTSVSVLVNSIVCDLYSDLKRRTAMLAFLQTVGPITLAVSPSIGGLLCHWIGWRNTFYVLVGWGALLLFLTAGMLRETLEARERRPAAEPGSKAEPPDALARRPAEQEVIAGQQASAEQEVGAAATEASPWCNLAAHVVRCLGTVMGRASSVGFLLFIFLLFNASFSMLMTVSFTLHDTYGLNDVEVALITGTLALGLTAGASVLRCLTHAYGNASSHALLAGLTAASFTGVCLCIASGFPLPSTFPTLILELYLGLTFSQGLIIPTTIGLFFEPMGDAVGLASGMLALCQLVLPNLCSIVTTHLYDAHGTQPAVALIGISTLSSGLVYVAIAVWWGGVLDSAPDGDG